MNTASAVRVADTVEDPSHQRMDLGSLWGGYVPSCVGVANVSTLGTTGQQLSHEWFDDDFRLAVGTATRQVYFLPDGEMVTIQIALVLHLELGLEETGGTGASVFETQTPGWICISGHVNPADSGANAIRRLKTENEYLLKAVEKFQRVNASASHTSTRAVDSLVQIMNLSIERGYHPVAAVDDDDNSLEIEARLDPHRLLLLQVWASGAVEGVIFQDVEGFKRIEATTVSSVLEWLTSEKFSR